MITLFDDVVEEEVGDESRVQRGELADRRIVRHEQTRGANARCDVLQCRVRYKRQCVMRNPRAAEHKTHDIDERRATYQLQCRRRSTCLYPARPTPTASVASPFVVDIDVGYSKEKAEQVRIGTRQQMNKKNR